MGDSLYLVKKYDCGYLFHIIKVPVQVTYISLLSDARQLAK